MPVDPLGSLNDVLYGVEKLGRGLIGQPRIRLAVTGLTRAGKTVFITSLVANLLAAGRGRRTLPLFEAAAGGRLRSVRLVPSAQRERCRASTWRRIWRRWPPTRRPGRAGPTTSRPWS